jgi:hypothetical protein
VPEEYIDNVEKMVSSFYIGSVVEFIAQPKLLEAGKFIAGGEFVLRKHSVYPIKTYESYEADPMDSLLGSYSKVNVDEKICLQILISPLSDSWLKKLREKTEGVKEGKDKPILKRFWYWFWDFTTGKNKDKDAENELVKHEFSQTQLGDFDKKLDDELFQVKIRALVTSPEEHRTHKILDDLARSFNQYNYPGLNALKFQQVPAHAIKQFAQEFVDRLFFSDR